MDAENLIFPLNSPKWGLTAPNVVHVEQKFTDNMKIFSHKFRGRRKAIAPLIICHDATVCIDAGISLCGAENTSAWVNVIY